MKLPNLHNPLKLFAPALAGPVPSAAGATGGNMMFASSGSGSGSGGYDDDDYGYDDEFGYDDEPVEEARPAAPRSNRTRRSAGAESTGGRSRSGSYQSEERYWTDYLRIALPVIGLVLMLGVLWIWASSLIGGDSDTTDTDTTDNVALVETQTVDPNAVNTEPQTASTPGANAGEIPISNNTTATETATTATTGGTFNPTQTETPLPGGDDQSAATSEPESDGIAEDAFVVTTDAVNMRPSAGTSEEPVREVPAGETFVVIGGPEEADGYTWWNVVSDDEGDSGWIAEDFLELAP